MYDFVDIHTHRPTEARTIRTAGIHPWRSVETDAVLEEELARLETGLSEEPVDAVGEIGLDFARRELRDPAIRSRQFTLFRRQLDLAERNGKPVVLHVVRAFEETLRELAGRRLPAVIFHGFIGSPEQAARALAAGYYLSFGERTARSPRTIEALRLTPPDRIFVESDKSPTPIAAIYASIAALAGIPLIELRQAAARNYERLFENANNG